MANEPTTNSERNPPGQQICWTVTAHDEESLVAHITKLLTHACRDMPQSRQVLCRVVEDWWKLRQGGFWE